MTKDFDPYHKWLGIPPQDQPPNHYRLLALGLFESDPEVIDAAANRQMAYLQQRATGERAAISQKLLNELSAARLCLLNREKKAAYDAELKAKQGTASKETTSSQPGSPQPDSLAFLQTTKPATDREEFGEAKKIDQPSTAGQPTATVSVSKQTPSPLPKILVGVGGGVVVLAVILFITFGRGKKADVEGGNTTISHRITAATGEVSQDPGAFAGHEQTTKPDKSKGVAQQTAEEKKSEKPPSVPPSEAKVEKGPSPVANLPTAPPASEPERASGPKEPSSAVTPNSSTGPTINLLEHPEHLNVPSGAILVLTFEEKTLRRENGTLTEVADLSGTNHTGSVHDAVLVEGRVGNGLEFGDGRYVKVPGPFPTGKEPRTFAAWMKAAEKHSRIAFTQGGDGTHEGFGLAAPIRWQFVAGHADRLKTDVWVDTEWHHHAVTYDGGEICYYYDAHVVLKESTELQTAAGPLILGAGLNKANNFKGVIDEVAVFDRALSPNEVEQIYQLGINGIPLADSGQSNSGPQKKPLDASAPQLSATDVLKNRLKGTKWLNDHNITFEWTTDGRFLHRGTEYEWKAIDSQRVQITFGSDHVDTLVFNDDFTEFKQLVRGKERKVYQGKRQP